MDTTLTHLPEIVSVDGNRLVTDSRRVAKHFKKRHGDVLRAYDKLECSDSFRERNFASRDYVDARGKTWRLIDITRDGFMFIVMGFTGKEAAAAKEKFIDAFNTMADQLQRRDLGLWQQMQALIAREVESKVRASFGSHLMLVRKQEMPGLRSEHERLETAIQPRLPLMH